MNIAPAELITGWMTTEELCFLAKNASTHNFIIEAGSYCGRSTRVLADNTPGIVYAVDPWGKHYPDDNPGDSVFKTFKMGNPPRMRFNKNLQDHILSGKVTAFQKEFTNFELPLHQKNFPDMIFIDALHEYEPVKADIAHALSLMPNGGLLCGHDYSQHWPDVIAAVDEIFGKGIQVTGTIWSLTL